MKTFCRLPLIDSFVSCMLIEIYDVTEYMTRIRFFRIRLHNNYNIKCGVASRRQRFDGKMINFLKLNIALVAYQASGQPGVSIECHLDFLLTKLSQQQLIITDMNPVSLTKSIQINHA